MLAERLGIGRAGWASETHALACLWSGELVRVVRQRATTFQVACPDALDGLEKWWTGNVNGLGRSSTIFVLIEPAPGVREGFRFGGLDRIEGRPRYSDYANVARTLASS